MEQSAKPRVKLFLSLAAPEESVTSCEQNIVICGQLGPLPPHSWLIVC